MELIEQRRVTFSSLGTLLNSQAPGPGPWTPTKEESTMRNHKGVSRVLAGLCGPALLPGLTALTLANSASPATPAAGDIDPIASHASQMLALGRDTFRYDTFGDQVFWSRLLGLEQALRQVSPKAALGVGLKVDSEALPAEVLAALKRGAVNLDDPAVTATLVKLRAVVGVKGFYNPDGSLR